MSPLPIAIAVPVVAKNSYVHLERRLYFESIVKNLIEILEKAN